MKMRWLACTLLCALAVPQAAAAAPPGITPPTHKEVMGAI